MATGTVIPSPVFTGIDSNGDPFSGGKLHTYAAGTTTNQATYSNVDLTSANANPIVLDSAGRATIFTAVGASFKYVLKDADDVTIWTADNINAVPVSTATLDVTVTAGETLTALDAVYISQGDGSKTAGRAYKTDADTDYSSSSSVVVGLLPADITNGGTGSVRMGGALSGYSGLTGGAKQYVSATPGGITATAPTNVRLIGQASDSTTIVLVPVPTLINASNIIGGTLVALRGGTGNATYAVGDILYADNATTPTLARLAGVAAGQVLASGGVGAAPAWSSAPAISGLTASQAVFTDGSKALASNAITGTGNVVMSASPSLTGRPGISNASAADVPLLDVFNTSSAVNYIQGIHVISANMNATHTTGYAVGQAWSNKNSGGLGFYWASDQSDDSYLYLGLHSVDDVVRVYGNGATGLSNNVVIKNGRTTGDEGGATPQLAVWFTSASNWGEYIIDTSSSAGSKFLLFGLNPGTGSSAIGSVTRNGSTSAVLFNTTSDERYKTSQGVVTDASAVLSNLQVHDFLWNDDATETVDRGFFAQEAQVVTPRGVTAGDAHPTTVSATWMMDRSVYIPDLVVGWQQHQAAIAALDARIAVLESA